MADRSTPAVIGSSLSPADEALFGPYRRAVLTELGPDFRLGFKLAYFANFASPAIAGPLDASAEIMREPMRRAKDTSIVVYEIIANGFESARGSRMTELLRRVHRDVPGSADDFRYVLLALLVIPIRTVDRSGARRTTAAERAAATRFYDRLGTAMGLDDIPGTYAEAAAFCRRYERANARRSEAGDRLMASTLAALLGSVPQSLRPVAGGVARFVVSALFGDRTLALALGLPVVPTPVARLVAAVRRAGRRRGAGREARVEFTSGERSRVYPAGYVLDDIGPAAGRHRSVPGAMPPPSGDPTTWTCPGPVED
ncbi:oxygenase MpaB family protein [Curtobacterium sp. RRHDQ10]|uniref:oxygenase MpaB family protein n=1 Tax=Curtobacterium phyllosphaerae TaxID=3413379 RepID=UPI003BF3EAA3